MPQPDPSAMGQACVTTGRVNILGVGVSQVTVRGAVSTIERWIAEDERRYVCVCGVHGLMESHGDAELRAIHNKAGMVTPDGMPLVWISHHFGFREAERVYGPDLMLAVCARSVPLGHRHYFYGGAPGVPERLAERLTARFPGMQVAGAFSPPFHPLDEDEEVAVMRAINEARPDIVWVGLSTPKQERWMATYRETLKAPVLIGVGAAFDFHAGLKAQAPRWIQRSGLEWLFRLWQEPRRLWRRYLRNNPLFIWYFGLQMLGVRTYSLDS